MKYLETEIREIQDSDFEQVMEIEKLCFKHPWDPKDFYYEVRENRYSNFWVIELSNEQLGLKQICGFVDFWITFDSATICQIAIHPDLQHMQLGSLLMEEVIRQCHASRVISICLEVRVSNSKAIAFYKKFGFQEVTIKEKYYSDGEDAIYMILEVKI